MPALRASSRKLEPAGTSISFFSLTNTTLGMEIIPSGRERWCNPLTLWTFARILRTRRSWVQWGESRQTMNEGNAPAVRLAHLSDVHISAERLGWRLRDYFNKRWTGWINYRWLGRRRRFRRGGEVLSAIVREFTERRPDHVIFSGDATALGFEPEFAHAAEMLRVGNPAMPPGLAVPGNHDYYTRATARSGLFEKYFAPWQ